MKKQDVISVGKAKTLYATDDQESVIMEFRNDTSAFDGVKKAQLSRKGLVNNHFNAFVMEKLAAKGIATHFLQRINDTESLVKRLTMLPVECVVRNIASGSLTKRLGIPDGTELTPPVFEFFLKNDDLHDPMINESHIKTFAWATESQVDEMKALTLKANEHLSQLFSDAGMLLVDYKLEFGLTSEGQLVLADEFSPDGCRIWDKETKEKLDKDRFRQDLGDVVESYEIVAQRLGISIPK